MPNPHQEAIDKLVNRVLPLVRAMSFAQNRKEPWLGNATVDKAVIATIETCFAIADQDRMQAQAEFKAESEETLELEPVVEADAEVTPIVSETPADGSLPPQ
jgi:hypothetical protein